MKGGNEWESNPPRLATRPATGFEDRGAHRDPITPELCSINILMQPVEIIPTLVWCVKKSRYIIRDLLSWSS